MIVQIVVIKPSNDVTVLSFESPDEIVIGRSSASHCRLSFDPLVSRRHARLLVRDDALLLEDLESRNGVWVNGSQFGGLSGRKMAAPLPIGNGAMVRIGGTTLSILFSANDAPITVDPGLTGPDATHSSFLWNEFPENGVSYLIPGYHIEGLVGSGGMAVVFKARRKPDGERVAIKTMHPGVAIHDRMLGSFHREIEVTKKIDHPNIVKFHDSGVTANSIIYLVLEYVEGGDLAKLIADSPNRRMPPRQAYSLATQIASGMGHAHSLGIVHRDLKPHNILLTRDLSAKISDLGLAKHFDDSESSGFTGTDTGGGTMGYMPPEQLTEFRDVKPNGDVFSFGATLYEMLTGQVPYDFSTHERFDVVANARIIPLSAHGIDLPRELVRVVNKCLSAHPNDRYQNCGEVAEAMRSVGW